MKNATIVALALTAVVLFGACGRGDGGEISSGGSETKTETTNQEIVTDTVTSTEITKTDSDTTEVDTTENVTTPPETTESSVDLVFPEPEEGATTILPDVVHLTATEVMEQLRSKSCPEELLPKLKEELSLSELADLLPYFSDMTVWSFPSTSIWVGGR